MSEHRVPREKLRTDQFDLRNRAPRTDDERKARSAINRRDRRLRQVGFPVRFTKAADWFGGRKSLFERYEAKVKRRLSSSDVAVSGGPGAA